MRKILSCFIAYISLLLVPGFSYAQVVTESSQPRNEIIQALMDTYQEEFGQIFPSEWNPKAKISGIVRASMGIESDGTAVFRRSHMDLNERNWRILSDSALNNRTNTYDPAIYSRLQTIVDASVKDAVTMHLNLTIDPWSYIGKTKEVSVTGIWGDNAKVQHFYAGGTSYTWNHTVNTLRYGGFLGMPQVKVKDGRVPAMTIGSSVCNEWGQCDQFSIPEMKLEYTFQPVREFWVDVNTANEGKIRFFPMAYQDQALTSDDPLKLSNNKAPWEASPWINDWSSGQVNHTNGNPEDFTKGSWDNSLAFAVRDSDGLRLTALRGVGIDLNPTDDLSVKGVVATPKTLWQEYRDVRAIPGSVRVKQMIGDRMYVGGTGNMHLGFVNEHLDKKNYVGSVDTAILPLENVKLAAQGSSSISRNDIQTSNYITKTSGQAYFASLEAISHAVDPLKKDYLAQKAEGSEAFYKTKFYFGRMDKDFESSLSNYHETRDDAFWSRHLTYYPSLYRYLPGTWPTSSQWDQLAFAVGNGLDYGRKAYGLRADTTQLDGKLDGMGDIRYVTTTEDKMIETVARSEWQYKVNDKLSTKALGVMHNLPQTRSQEDPFIVSSTTGEAVVNTAILGGKDRDLRTGGLGARYELTDWASVNGVWEYSNDMTVASDNFPRGLFDGISTKTVVEDGRIYRVPVSYLYDQGFFSQAPYPYHNIFKAGLHLKPTSMWDVYFDYTRNPNKFAGAIDDNVDHVGVETTFMPRENFGFYARYTMSRAYDINRLNKDKVLDYRRYHNVFLETRYKAPKDQLFSVSYGVGPAYLVETQFSNPLISYYAAPVLVTEHIVRLSYEKKF